MDELRICIKCDESDKPGYACYRYNTEAHCLREGIPQNYVHKKCPEMDRIERAKPVSKGRYHVIPTASTTISSWGIHYIWR